MQHTENFSKKSLNNETLILYLSYDGILDPVGRSQILPYLLELQPEINFILITYEKDSQSREFHEMKSLLSQTSIHWIPLKFHQKIRMVSTILNLLQGKKTIKKIFSSYPVSIVHARSYVSAWLLYKPARKHNVPLIFDMRGFWVDERIEGNIWPENFFTRIIYRYFKKLEQKIIRSSNHIITLTHEAKRWIQDNWQVNPDKITVIPCCTSYEKFNPDSIDISLIKELRKKLSIPEQAYVLGYLGSTGTWYLVDEMLVFFKELKKQRPDAYFLMMVNHAGQEVKEKVSSESSIILLERIPYQQIPLYLSMVDAVIMFIKPTFSKIASSPIKMAEAFAMNKPIVINKGIGDTDFIEKHQLGIVVNQLSIDEYKEAIAKILNVNPRNIRELSRPSFDVASGSKLYLAVYQSLLDQST